ATHDLGREGVSCTGSQAGIVTDTAHGRARIVAMRSDRVRGALAAGRIAIVAGFQGVSTTLDVTTLGRGGSDTTAVALAAALTADVCEIYTDVEGVFTADPRIVPEARKLDTVTYEEMLDLAACGAKVLMLRALADAGVNVDMIVQNVSAEGHTDISFTLPKEDLPHAEAILREIAGEVGATGFTCDPDIAKVSLIGAGMKSHPGVAADMFDALA